MFVEFTTTRGERFVVNIDHILFVSADKKFTYLYLSDGMRYDVAGTYEDIKAALFIEE